MKKFTLLCFVIISTLLAVSVKADHPLSIFHGDWQGSGTTRGMESSISFTWKSGFDSRYTILQLNNRMTSEEGVVIEFAGVAYYQVADEHLLSGIWIDSQGDILELNATLEKQRLIAIWGSESTKMGRSIYQLRPDGKLEAIDFIRDEQGAWHEFSRTILIRTK